MREMLIVKPEVYEKGLIIRYYCPVCGKEILATQQSGSHVNVLKVSSCPHLATILREPDNDERELIVMRVEEATILRKVSEDFLRTKQQPFYLF